MTSASTNSKESFCSDELPPPKDLRTSPKSELDEIASCLFRIVGPRIFSLGLRFYSGDRERAEELVGATFVRVVGSLKYFRGQSRYQTWVFSIAMRVIIDGRRRAMTRRRLQDRLRELALGREREAPSEVENALGREQGMQIREALGALRTDHRMVLCLIAIDGLSHREAADLLGIAEGTLWSRYARARLALAQEMKKRAPLP